jgi:hypothetical protein
VNRAAGFLHALPPAGERFWQRHGERLLRIAVALELAAALPWLAYQLWRLLSAAEPVWPGSVRGGLDLASLHAWSELWFDGVDPYRPENVRPLAVAVYPPASFLLLWPFVGWLDVDAARLLWAATALGALFGLSRLAVRASAVRTPVARWFVGLLPAALYPAGATLGNGQSGLHVVALLVAAVLHFEQRPRGAARSVVASLAMLWALFKPSLAAPFFWLVLLARGGWRPAAAIAAGYAALTGAACAFQPAGVASLLGEWAAGAAAVTSRNTLRLSHGNLQNFLVARGLEAWFVPAALGALLALGAWILLHRDADVWLRLGVTALVTRFVSYHGWYDDLLILLPAIALLRLAGRAGPGAPARFTAGWLVALAFALHLAPGGQYLLPPPWRGLFLAAQLALWIAMLATLLAAARARPPRGASGAGAVNHETRRAIATQYRFCAASHGIAFPR